MKRLFLIVFFFSAHLLAQFEGLYDTEAKLNSGFGITWINGSPHYSFRIFPEIQFSKVSLGLNLNLEFTPNGKLRAENFNEFSDYLSIIRYVKYGNKYDPIYFRIGALDYSTLGHGSIVYLYNNSPSYDSHKIGTEFDLDFGKFGFETIYGNFGQSGLLGLRANIRPFQFTKLSYVPILKDIEFGSSIVTDTDNNSGIIDGDYDINKNIFIPTKSVGNITIIGFDIGLPLVRTSTFDLDFYFDYTKILKFGNGSALGAMISSKGFSFINIKAKLERRFNGNKYMPSYFNSLYEIERFQVDTETGKVKTKTQLLAASPESKGYFGELLINILGTFKIVGSFQKLDNITNSGILHLWTLVGMDNFPYVFRAGYDKLSIKEFMDLFKANENSYVYAEFGYKLYTHLLFSIVYSWNFTPIRNNMKEIIGYKTQKKLEPRLSFVYPISFKK
ncbi:MAG: hypothetical protein N2249_03815 [Melioribacter sp.]|nr:hypothetical protein [Melioribacter sp.]